MSHLFMSIIFLIFVLTVEGSESGSRGQLLAEGRLQPAFIYNKGSITFNYIYICLYQMLYLYLFSMITIIYITFPLLIVWGFNVLNTILGDIYIKLKTFLFDED